jgi:hypothetical protein
VRTLLLAVVRGVAIFGATAIILLQQSSVWPDAPKWLIVGAVLVLAVLAAVGPIATATADRRRKIDADEERKIREILVQALLRVAETTTVPCDDLGLHAFAIRRPITSYLRLSEPYLDRVARVRLATLPVPSQVRWVKGKGVVGLCWSTGREASANLDELQGPYAGCSEAEWALLPESITLNLTFGEFQATSGKYGCAVATPIVDSQGTIVGCVSLDGPATGYSALSTGVVYRMLQDAAQSIAGHLTTRG